MKSGVSHRLLNSRKPPCVEVSGAICWTDRNPRGQSKHSGQFGLQRCDGAELKRLKSAAVDIEAISVVVDAKRTVLRTINEKLWNLKAAMRLCESRNRFDAGFLQIARETQALEDTRARIRKEIDDAIG
jgi:hypothetical protein